MACAAVCALTLTGCGGGSLRQQLGLEKNAPDEFAVVTRAPLSVPPEYSLRPPQPGAPRPQEQSTTQVARQALVGEVGSSSAATIPAASGAGAAVLQQAGAGAASEDIRATVDAEARARALEVQENNTFSGIMMQSSRDAENEQVVDAASERQRIEEARQRQQAITGKDAATAEEKRGTIWERWFGL